jgi:UPF0755 protein
MNDIRPPKRMQRPVSAPARPMPRVVSAAPTSDMPSQSARPVPPAIPGSGFGAGGFAGKNNASPASSTPSTSAGVLAVSKKKSKLKIVLWSFVSLILLFVVAAAILFGWYTLSLEPVSRGDESRTRVEIISGSSPSQIGQLLEEKKLIRSSSAFDIYTRLTGTRNKLQAGTYSLSPSESTKAIVDHLVAGKVDQFSLTFLPGATLAQNRAGLLSAGYGEAEVDAALEKVYDHPLFATKPETADLEGYIYGETYKFDSSASVEDVLKKTFDHYYEVLTKNNLIEGFKSQGLSLYEGITLASIVQREVPTSKDQKQVAQVFLSRLAVGMMLGSDVTYQYAAKKMGVPPSPSLDSPYNTRKYAGLPPGPIATPGLSAMQAVAAPATGDYVFFLSGDDDITYFARTDAEHQANIRNHCQKKCLIP